MQRRRFLGLLGTASGAAATGLYPSLANAIDYAKPVPEAEGLTAYQADSAIQLRIENRAAIGYRAYPTLKYPYFFPLNGPISGLPLTTESALPYPHHRGLWLGCDPLNGGNYWADNGPETGQIVSTDLKIADTPRDDHRIVFSEKCSWRREGSNPFNDERLYSVEVVGGNRVHIDCSFKLRCNEDISIENAKHSFFALRAAADISPSYGGTLFNSHGNLNAAGTYGKTADWCGYFGRRRLNPDVTEGIAIMNHPKNFGGNCPWLTRDYGHLSPSPFNFLDKPWTIERGATLELQYRVVLFAGTPQETKLATVYKDWLSKN